METWKFVAGEGRKGTKPRVNASQKLKEGLVGAKQQVSQLAEQGTDRPRAGQGQASQA